MMKSPSRRLAVALLPAALSVALSVGTLPAVALATAAPAGARTPLPVPEPEFSFADPRITDASGLAASRRHEGVLWTHNDRAHEQLLFAVGPDGKTVAAYTLRGHQPVDWEAIALTPDGSLLLGDIGDNESSRTDGIVLMEVAEPERLADGELAPKSYRLTYPDGPHDAETMFVDPSTSERYVVTKSTTGGVLYRMPRPLLEGNANLLVKVRNIPHLVTDGGITSDGRMILRGYDRMRVFDHVEGTADKATATVDLPKHGGGEALAVAPDSRSVLVGGEGENSPVWRIPLPDAAPETPRPTPEPGLPSKPAPTSGGGVPVLTLTAGILAVVAVGLGGMLVMRRRHSRVSEAS